MFLNVSSNCLHRKKHTHIGCISLTFLHCAFSNGSSNYLPEKRHSHIGYIYLTFLHCAFSNVNFGRLNIIRIRIRSFSEGRILFVFVFGHFWKTEYYSYSYSVIFGRPNNIRIRIRSSKHYSLTSDGVYACSVPK